MDTEKIIERATELLYPIGFEPEDIGYYIRLNGEDMGETFCGDCIKGEVKLVKREQKRKRQEVLAKYKEIDETGYYRGTNIKGLYGDAEIKKSKRYELKDYPAKNIIVVESCDPDFGGGATEPKYCHECGQYFYTDFEPDLECAERLFEYFFEEFEEGALSPSFKWELSIAFQNFIYLEDDVKDVLIKIANKIIKNN